MKEPGFLVTVIVTLILAGTGSAVTTVCPDGCNYTALQDAVDAADSGDLLLVEGGVYPPLNLTRRLTLRGSNRPVVDGLGRGSAITLSADGIALDGFVMTNSTGPGIDVRSDENVVISCLTAYNGIGIRVEGKGNSIAGNEVRENGDGIWVSGSGNLIHSNVATENGCGICSEGSNNTILNNSLADNSETARDRGRNLWSGNYYGQCDGDCLPRDIPGGSMADEDPLSRWPDGIAGLTVTPVEAYQFLLSGESIFLDIRTPEEYRSGQIDGALNIDYYSEDFRRDLDRLDKSQSYIIYCRTGYRTKLALEAMAALGFEDVRSISGGKYAWMDAGLPVILPGPPCNLTPGLSMVSSRPPSDLAGTSPRVSS